MFFDNSSGIYNYNIIHKNSGPEYEKYLSTKTVPILPFLFTYLPQKSKKSMLILASDVGNCTRDILIIAKNFHFLPTMHSMMRL